MKERYYNMHTTNNDAFTLIEVLVTLSIVFLVFNLMSLTQKQTKQLSYISRHQQKNIDWHLASNDLTQFVSDATLVKVKTQGNFDTIFFKKAQNAQQIYQLKKYRQEIVISGNQTGYMPIMTGKILMMKYQEPFIKIILQNQLGNCYESYYQLKLGEKDAQNKD